MKKGAEMWNTMSDADKAPYVKIHEEDVQRHEREMKEFNEKGYFINSDGVKSTDLTKKHKVKDFPDDTVMPKKAKTSYMAFNKENYDALAKEIGSVKVADVAKKLSERWGALTPKQKKKYEDLAEKDQVRYQNQIDELRSNGYFMMEDGTKSTDTEPKKKRARK